MYMINNNMKIFYYLIVTLLLYACGGGNHGTSVGTSVDPLTGEPIATLTWDYPPIEYAPDGTPSRVAIDGFNVYYGTESRNYSEKVDIGSVKAREYVVTGLERGVTYYFTLTAYSYTYGESEYSNEPSLYIGHSTNN